ncbi:MAG: transporter [Bacteroidota bacterium]
MKKLLFISFSLSFLMAYGQEETIFTDRPNVTDAVTLISPGTFQVELGYYQTIFKSERSSPFSFPSRYQSTDTSIPNFAVKYGLFDWLELRIMSSYKINRSVIDGLPDFKSDGFTHFIFSPKFSLFDQAGALPQISLATGIAYHSNDNTSFYLTPTLLLQYTFNKFTIGGSIATYWQWDFRDRLYYSYTIVGSYTIFQKLGIFMEAYGDFDDGQFGIDAGLTYLLTNRLQIDAIYNRNLGKYIRNNGETIEYSYGFGLAWNTNFKD